MVNGPARWDEVRAAGSKPARSTKLKCCPTCNRPFPPEIVVGGIIRQRVFDYVKDHPEGVAREDIMRHVYADDCDGGPASFNTIAVMVCHINRILREQGAMMYITGKMGAHNDRYRLYYGVRK